MDIKKIWQGDKNGIGFADADADDMAMLMPICRSQTRRSVHPQEQPYLKHHQNRPKPKPSQGNKYRDGYHKWWCWYWQQHTLCNTKKTPLLIPRTEVLRPISGLLTSVETSDPAEVKISLSFKKFGHLFKLGETFNICICNNYYTFSIMYINTGYA